MSLRQNSLVKVVGALLLVSTLSGCSLWNALKERFSNDGNTASDSSSRESIPLVRADQGTPSGDLGPVVVRVAGRDVLRKAEFSKYLKQMLQFYPQLKGIMDVDALPLAFKKTFLNKIVEQELVVAKASEAGYDQTDSFAKNYAEAVKLVRRHLLLQEFEKRLLAKLEISDDQVRSEYDTNKTKYVKSPGGAMVMGVVFDKTADARDFLLSVKGKEAEFASLGRKESRGSFKNLGLVSGHQGAPSQASAVVTKAALSASRDGGVLQVVDGAKTWVLNVGKRSDVEYFAFDDIKGQIETLLKNQSFQEALAKEMEVLRKKYPVEVIEEHLAVPAQKDSVSHASASPKAPVAA